MSGLQVCMGASLQCSFGTAPCAFIVLPANKTLTNTPAANIMDNKPFVNVPTFVMCNSVANPATKRPPPVLFSPAPCVPNLTAPWAPGSVTHMIGNMPALDQSSKLMCMWGGVINVVSPGQFKATHS